MNVPKNCLDHFEGARPHVSIDLDGDRSEQALDQDRREAGCDLRERADIGSQESLGGPHDALVAPAGPAVEERRIIAMLLRPGSDRYPAIARRAQLIPVTTLRSPAPGTRGILPQPRNEHDDIRLPAAHFPAQQNGPSLVTAKAIAIVPLQVGEKHPTKLESITDFAGGRTSPWVRGRGTSLGDDSDIRVAPGQVCVVADRTEYLDLKVVCETIDIITEKPPKLVAELLCLRSV